MKERKVHYALRLLDAYEINSLRKFLQSPFFNQKESILLYFNILTEALKEPKGIENLDEKEVWYSIFGTEFEDVKFRKFNSDFYSLIEKFLTQKEIEADTQLINYFKINALRNRNAEKLYGSLLADIDVTRRTDPNRNAQYFLNQYNIEKAIFSLIPEDERKKDFRSNEYGLDIDKISINLDVYFISEKLKYYSNILSWNQLYHTDLNIKGIDLVMRLANNPIFKEVPVIAIFTKIIQLKTDPDNEMHFFELKDLVSAHLHLFPPFEGKEIIDAMLNYCINKVNKGIFSFERQVFEIYQKGLDSEAILVNSILETSDYRNIAMIGLRLGEIPWVDKFINDYAQKLDPRYRDNAFYFSLARLETYRANYEKVIDNINKIIFDDVWYNLNARSLLMTAYFELGEIQVLESLLQSFRAYVAREKSLPKSRKTNYLNLISFTRQLLSLDNTSAEKLNELKEKITSTQGVVNKPWLLEKINALMVKKRK